MNAFFLLAALAGAASTPPPASHPPFAIGAIQLLQPDWLIGQRTAVQDLSRTIKRVEAIAADWSRGVDGGDSCIVHVALRAGHRFRTWTTCEAAHGAALDARVAKAMAASDVAEVSEGTVVFALRGATQWAGGEGMDRFPKAWIEAAGNEPIEMEALVDRAWPE